MILRIAAKNRQISSRHPVPRPLLRLSLGRRSDVGTLHPRAKKALMVGTDIEAVVDCME